MSQGLLVLRIAVLDTEEWFWSAPFDGAPPYLESGLRSASLRGSATCSYSSSVTCDASGVIQRREPWGPCCRGMGGPRTLMVPCTPADMCST